MKKNTYRLLLPATGADRYSAEGERVRDLLRTMYPGEYGYRVRMHEYKNVFYRWFIRVTTGTVAGFTVQVSEPKNNRLFIRTYEESRFSTEYSGWTTLLLIITFLTVLLSRFYLHKEKPLLVAVIYTSSLVIITIILKKIFGIILVIILGKKISSEEINQVGYKIKEQLR